MKGQVTYKGLVDDERRLNELGGVPDISAVPRMSATALMEPRVFDRLHPPLPVLCVAATFPADGGRLEYHMRMLLLTQTQCG
ncbi:hypothetical protein M8J77_004723 [Diaphorina citri]|nr:hypothetical protein M8J77_004723 [Diaphorina citri]